MSTLTQTLELPAYLDGAEVFAGAYSSGRQITWTLKLDEDRKVLGNKAAWAWFTVQEVREHANEADRAYGQRRITDHGERLGFTDAAAARIRTDLLSAVNRYGFDRLFRELHAKGDDDRTDTAFSNAAKARRAAEWWDQQAWLIQINDLLVREPLPNGLNDRAVMQQIASPDRPYGDGYATVISRLLLDGEHVGWVTTDHTLIPNESILKPPPKVAS